MLKKEKLEYYLKNVIELHFRCYFHVFTIKLYQAFNFEQNCRLFYYL